MNKLDNMTVLPVSEREFIVAGHSHTFTLGMDQGYEGPIVLRPASNWGPNGFFLLETWHGERSQNYWRILTTEAKDRDVVLSYSGNQHHGNFLFSSKTPFDFVWSDNDPYVLPDADLIPKKSVRAFMDFTLRDLRALIPMLYEAGALRVFILGSPGQRRDIQNYAQKLLDTEFARSFAQSIGFNIEDLTITPATVLRKLWQTMQESYAQLANESDAIFIAVPPSGFDSDGYLHPDLHNGDDLSHANAAFGQLMVDTAIGAIRGKVDS